MNSMEGQLVFESIRKGLEQNHRDYELYRRLGDFYAEKNINQAWLCYENAEFYCDNTKDLVLIRNQKHNAEQHPDWCVKPVSVVILSYNQLEMTKQCIESLRKHNICSSY